MSRILLALFSYGALPLLASSPANLAGNVVHSLEVLSHISPQPKTAIYATAKNSLLASHEWGTDTYAGWMTLCASHNTLSSLIPVLKAEAAPAVQPTQAQILEFHQALSAEVASGCRSYRFSQSIWNTKSHIALFHTTWKGLFGENTSEEILAVSKHLKELFNYVNNPGELFTNTLSDFLIAYEEASDFVHQQYEGTSSGPPALLEKLHASLLELSESGQLPKRMTPGKHSGPSMNVDPSLVALARVSMPALPLGTVGLFEDLDFDESFRFAYVDPSKGARGAYKFTDHRVRYFEYLKKPEFKFQPPERAYQIQVAHVSKELFERLVGYPAGITFKGPDEHATVGWASLMRFVNAINNTRNDGYHYRVPTAREWEYAYRMDYLERAQNDWLSDYRTTLIKLVFFGNSDWRADYQTAATSCETNPAWMNCPGIRLVREYKYKPLESLK